MTRCGCRRCSARTGTGCWRERWRKRSSRRCCGRFGSGVGCRASISAGTGRCWGRGGAAVCGDDPGNPTVDFHGEKRSNQTHQSRTDPEALLAKKGKGKEAKLCYAGHVLIENRHGFVVNTVLTQAYGRAEPDAALWMAEQIPGTSRGNLGTHKAYEKGDV